MLLIVCQVKQGWKIIELKRNDMTCEAREKNGQIKQGPKMLNFGPRELSPSQRDSYLCCHLKQLKIGVSLNHK